MFGTGSFVVRVGVVVLLDRCGLLVPYVIDSCLVVLMVMILFWLLLRLFFLLLCGSLLVLGSRDSVEDWGRGRSEGLPRGARRCLASPWLSDIFGEGLRRDGFVVER